MAEALRPGGLYKDGETWRNAQGEVVAPPTAEEKKKAAAKSAAAWEEERALVEVAGRTFRLPPGVKLDG